MIKIIQYKNKTLKIRQIWKDLKMKVTGIGNVIVIKCRLDTAEENLWTGRLILQN